MGAWKQFTNRDVTITSFIADKGFSFASGSITGSENGINIYEGLNVNYTSSINAQSGFEYSSSVNSIYNSAKQLYYKNYLSSSIGDYANTGSIVPGATREDDVLQGPVNGTLYDNYLQSTLLQKRYFPTGSNERISTISVPTYLYGEKIVPYTFELELSDTFHVRFPGGLLLKDDGDGNIISGSEDVTVGQIFYSHGITVLTTHSCEIIGAIVNAFPQRIDNMQIRFSSSLTINEQQYRCTILENEFNKSTNPTLLTQSIAGALNTSYYDFATGSFFEPYVTCVGLYNGNQDLVAVGKLSFPLPISRFTDTTIVVNYDV
jgi:hypothetical protein